MYLTGQQLLETEIINNGVLEKVDDGIVPSFGPDGCGYTLRGDFRTARFTGAAVIILNPMQSMMVKSWEFIKMPTTHFGYCLCKSTYARQGIISVVDSAIDPGYKGQLSIRFFNSGSEPVTVYAEGGLVMLVTAPISGEHQYNGRWQGK